VAACAAAAASSADGVSSVQFYAQTEDGKLTLVRSNGRVPSAPSPESPGRERWSQVLSADAKLPGDPDYGDGVELADEDEDPAGSVFGSFVGLAVGDSEEGPDSTGTFSQIPAGVLRAARSREPVRLDGTTFQVFGVNRLISVIIQR